jgi:hypothetical protein
MFVRRNVLKRIFIIIISVMLSQVCTPVLAGSDSPTVYFTKGHGEQSIDREFKKLKGIPTAGLGSEKRRIRLCPKRYC